MLVWNRILLSWEKHNSKQVWVRKWESKKKKEMGENFIKYSYWNGMQLCKNVCTSVRDKDKMNECDRRMWKMVTQLNHYVLHKCITIKWSALFHQFLFLSCTSIQFDAQFKKTSTFWNAFDNIFAVLMLFTYITNKQLMPHKIVFSWN